jgi:hypothetical protein
VKRSESYGKFKGLMEYHFESIVFAEIHWEMSVVKKIEKLIIPLEFSKEVN